MTFTIMFWNIWLDNQLKGPKGADKLLVELSRLISHHQPDFIGLNEVLQGSTSPAPFISDFLSQEYGYTYHRFAPSSPYTDDWIIGTAFYSRHKLKSTAAIAISKDTPAKKRGYGDHDLEAVSAKVVLPGRHKVNFIVAHPMFLRPHTMRDHYEATANLEALLRSKKFAKNTILGGDFNEPGLMPRAFKHKVQDIMHFRTGSKLGTTWRHNGWRLTPIRANLDQLYWSKKSDFSLQHFQVLTSHVSDHRPILATFEFK
jgi:endonuclease/exonuclease/phosphatase family metal-dependent hydrolase